jgi:hypothetical protein
MQMVCWNIEFALLQSIEVCRSRINVTGLLGRLLGVGQLSSIMVIYGYFS